MAGEPIDEAELDAHPRRAARPRTRGEPITFFEITTAAAFLAFADDPADSLLLETGLGGRLDATNVVDAAAARPASPPSRWTTRHYLGDTLAAIAAREGRHPEAGRARHRRPPGARGAGRDRAPRRRHRRPAPRPRPRLAGRASRAAGLVVETGGRSLDLPRPTLPGVHQIENGGLAVMAALSLPEAARRGRDHDGPADRPLAGPPAAPDARARWSTRLPPGCELWLDGGHNPAAGEALAATLSADADPRPLHLVVGMLRHQGRCARFLAPLATVAASLTAVPIASRAARPGRPRRSPPPPAASAFRPPSTLPSRRPSPPSGRASPPPPRARLRLALPRGRDFCTGMAEQVPRPQRTAPETAWKNGASTR